MILFARIFHHIGDSEIAEVFHGVGKEPLAVSPLAGALRQFVLRKSVRCCRRNATPVGCPPTSRRLLLERTPSSTLFQNARHPGAEGTSRAEAPRGEGAAVARGAEKERKSMAKQSRSETGSGSVDIPGTSPPGGRILWWVGMVVLLAAALTRTGAVIRKVD